jgi:hypothetical protein
MIDPPAGKWMPQKSTLTLSQTADIPVTDIHRTEYSDFRGEHAATIRRVVCPLTDIFTLRARPAHGYHGAFECTPRMVNISLMPKKPVSLEDDRT